MSKKIIIPRNSLPDPDILNSNYEIRYRIISEDRNRQSSWTPIFSVDPGLSYTPVGNLNIQKVTSYIAAAWNPVNISKDVGGVSTVIDKASRYDIWIRWGTTTYASPNLGEWQLQERVSTSSININIPSGQTYVSMEIYRVGRPIERSLTNGFLAYSLYNFAL